MPSVTAAEIENALYDAYGSRQVSTIYAPQDEYWVVTELLPKYQQDPSAMGYLYVQAASGQLLPLSSVATITKGAGPVAVAHSGQLPSVTLSFNLRPGVALGTATAEVQRLAAQSVPSGITHVVPGHGAGIPVDGVRAGGARGARHFRDLHRAGRALTRA